MKKYHSVVLFCMVLSLDTTWGSSNHHENRSREAQDPGGRTIEVSSSNGSSSEDSSPRTVTRKATKKTTATPTSAPTPTLQMLGPGIVPAVYDPNQDFCFKDNVNDGKYCWYYFENRFPSPVGQWEGENGRGSGDCGDLCTKFVDGDTIDKDRELKGRAVIRRGDNQKVFTCDMSLR